MYFKNRVVELLRTAGCWQPKQNILNKPSILCYRYFLASLISDHEIFSFLGIDFAFEVLKDSLKYTGEKEVPGHKFAKWRTVAPIGCWL